MKLPKEKNNESVRFGSNVHSYNEGFNACLGECKWLNPEIDNAVKTCKHVWLNGICTKCGQRF